MSKKEVAGIQFEVDEDREDHLEAKPDGDTTICVYPVEYPKGNKQYIVCSLTNNSNIYIEAEGDTEEQAVQNMKDGVLKAFGALGLKLVHVPSVKLY